MCQGYSSTFASMYIYFKGKCIIVIWSEYIEMYTVQHKLGNHTYYFCQNLGVYSLYIIPVYADCSTVSPQHKVIDTILLFHACIHCYVYCISLFS